MKSSRFVARAAGLASVFAVAMAAPSAMAAEPGSHAVSPLKLTDIISRPKFLDLKISPDGKYFAGTAVTDEGKGVLHILDRRTMSVVHSEVYSGPLGVGAFNWHDNDHLLITSTYKSELAEGRGSAGLFLLDIRTKSIHRVWNGDGTADYGGLEGADIGGRIDDEHYWMTVGPSGSSYSEFPYVYLYKLNIFTGRATKVLKSPSRVASFVFNKDNEVTHAIGKPPDDFDATVVHKRVNGEWVLEGTYDDKKGVSIPLRWHKTDPDKVLYRDNLDAQTTGYFWFDAKTGKKDLIYRDPKVDVDEVVFNEDDEAIAAKAQYDYPSYRR